MKVFLASILGGSLLFYHIPQLRQLKCVHCQCLLHAMSGSMVKRSYQVVSYHILKVLKMFCGEISASRKGIAIIIMKSLPVCVMIPYKIKSADSSICVHVTGQYPDTVL